MEGILVNTTLFKKCGLHKYNDLPYLHQAHLQPYFINHIIYFNNNYRDVYVYKKRKLHKAGLVFIDAFCNSLYTPGPRYFETP